MQAFHCPLPSNCCIHQTIICIKSNLDSFKHHLGNIPNTQGQSLLPCTFVKCHKKQFVNHLCLFRICCKRLYLSIFYNFLASCYQRKENILFRDKVKLRLKRKEERTISTFYFNFLKII